MTPPYEVGETHPSALRAGLRSAPLIAVSGVAIGVVLSMHTRASLERFGAESMIPAGLAIALVRETGPLTAGLLLSGRIGAGIGAEIGAMRVTEQIDALEASAVDAFRYLVVTRVIACVIALPILTTLMNFAGMLGGFIAETAATGMPLRLYFNRAFSLIDITDYVPATMKTMVFGFIIATTSSYLGFTTESGTEGVGRASTQGGRPVIDADHRDQRAARAAHLLHLSRRRRADDSECAMLSLAASPGRRRERSEMRAAVRLDHVTKAFGSRKVLDDVSFEVPTGAGFVILGRSGTGKSVTLRHMIGLVRPDSGRVFVSATTRSARWADRAVAGAQKDRVPVSECRALRLDLGRRERRLSDAPAHRPARRRRSGARATRSWPPWASIATTTRCRRRSRAACVSAPGWRERWRSIRRSLLVDEPSAGLDPITAEEIDSLLVELKQKGGVTLVVVTHNIPSARRLGDQLMMLHEGRVVARGSPTTSIGMPTSWCAPS